MFKWISKDRPAGLLLRCIAERKLNVAIVSVYVCFNLSVKLLLGFIRYSVLLHFSKHNESKWMQHCRISSVLYTHDQILLFPSSPGPDEYGTGH